MGRTQYERNCLHCGKLFKNALPKVRYCSLNCYFEMKRSLRKQYTCKRCGSLFHRHKNGKGSNPTYCSKQCNAEALNIRRHAICAHCNKPFSAHGLVTKYCSRRCRTAVFVAHRRYINHKTGEYRSCAVAFPTCKQCGILFTAKRRAGGKQRLLCSMTCERNYAYKNKLLIQRHCRDCMAPIGRYKLYCAVCRQAHEEQSQQDAKIRQRTNAMSARAALRVLRSLDPDNPIFKGLSGKTLESRLRRQAAMQVALKYLKHLATTGDLT